MPKPPSLAATAQTSDPISAAVAAGYAFEGAGARARRADARRDHAQRRTDPDPARHAQPARPGRRGDRHRQDQDPAAARRAALRRGRPGVRRRHQGRPLRPLRARARRTRRWSSVPASVGQEWQRPWLPGRVLRARRPGHRYAAARHHDRVRPDPARRRCSGSTTPRSRRWGWSSTTPTAPACRCSTSPTCARWSSTSPPTRARPTSRTSAASRSATAGVILRELIALLRPGRRRVLRRAGVRDQRPAADHGRRQGPDLARRAAQPGGPAGAVLDLPDVAAGRPVPRPARGRRRRQAQAGVLLRRGAPAVRRRLEGVPRRDRADRPADPVQGRRRLLRDPVAHRRTRRRARAARLPHPAPAARGDAQRRQGAQADGEHLPALRRTTTSAR